MLKLYHAYLLNEGVEFRICQRLYLAIYNHLNNGNIAQFNSLYSKLISDEVVLDVNVGQSMENRVVG